MLLYKPHTFIEKMMKVIIDDRERKIIPHIPKAFASSRNPITWETQRLNHADYIIVYEGIVIAMIERKRWSDLAQSIVDKRILNLENLKVFRKRIGCRLIILMEGVKHGKRGVSLKAMKAKLDHIMIRDEIFVDYSSNQAGTAARLVELCNNIISLRESPIVACDIEQHKQALVEITGGAQCEEIKSLRDAKEEVLGWCSLPGVDLVTMQMIRDSDYSLGDIMIGKLSMTELASMKYPSGNKVGYERAANILREAIKPQTAISILCSIRSVGKDMAKVILKSFDGSVEDLVNDSTIDIISNIKIPGLKGKHIGKKIAGRIMTTLSAKNTNNDSDVDSDVDSNG